MSDIIKSNWLIIVITLITFAVNGGLIAMTFVTGGKVKNNSKTLEQKRLEVESMKKYQFGMTEKNKALAIKNEQTAWDYYNKAYDQILKKYKVAKHVPEMAKDPAQVKRLVQKRTDQMTTTLRDNYKVELGSGVQNFTFEKIQTSTKLPPRDDVPLIVKNIIIVESIVQVLGGTGITHLLSLTRDEMKVKDAGDVYKYLTFNMTVKGHFDSIRNCINGLHNSKFLFVVRKVELEADDLVNSIGKTRTSTPEGPAPDMPDRIDRPTPSGQGVSKEDRIVFKDMASIKATIEFDYIELVRKSETGN